MNEAVRQRLLHSPYYADVFRERGLSPFELRVPEEVSSIPVLTREGLRAHLESMLAFREPEEIRTLHWRSSTGTTGVPLKVPRCDLDVVATGNFLRAMAELRGVDLPLDAKGAFVCPLSLLPPTPVTWPGLTSGKGFRFRRTKEPLEAWRPLFVTTSPNGIEWLLQFDVEISPLVIFSTAIELPDELRKRCEDHYGCPVVDYYSSSETGPLAYRCPSSSAFHVFGDYAYLESVDGKILVTRLRDSVLPLLRYALEDEGEIGRCPCGYEGQAILGFHGRTLDEKDPA